MSAEHAGPPPPTDLCQPFVHALPISGASVTVITASGTPSVLCSTDPTSARLEELQFELGEGPHWAAASSGQIIMVPDLGSSDDSRWPVFDLAARVLPVGAIFAIHLTMGAVTVGVAGLYRAARGELTPDQQITAVAIGSAIAATAVHRAIASAFDETTAETASKPALRREVQQAIGMILVQLDTTATIAYSRLQAFAFASGRTVHAVAHDVVARTITFDDVIP